MYFALSNLKTWLRAWVKLRIACSPARSSHILTLYGERERGNISIWCHGPTQMSFYGRID